MSMKAYTPVRLTATGDVPGTADSGICGGISVKAGTAAGTVTVRQGGSGGTVLFTLTTVANGETVNQPIPFQFRGQLHLTIAGAAVEATAFV